MKSPTTAQRVALEEIAPWRDMYRHEMNCQIIHDDIHARKGWSEEYALRVGEAVVGYGSVAVAGPWKEKPTIYEFFVAQNFRNCAFELFEIFWRESGAKFMEVQSNSTLLFVMLHTFATNVVTESILFRDEMKTELVVAGAKFRKVEKADVAAIEEHKLDDSAEWGIEVEGKLVAAGDILYHYNRPYGDIYMKVAEPFRQRGFGSLLVQELKRVCYEGGSIPGARCNPTNVASRKTLQRAGFVPFGHILDGVLP
jgi:GNAT superfamily N-acetyltransferase